MALLATATAAAHGANDNPNVNIENADPAAHTVVAISEDVLKRSDHSLSSSYSGSQLAKA